MEARLNILLAVVLQLALHHNKICMNSLMTFTGLLLICFSAISLHAQPTAVQQMQNTQQALQQQQPLLGIQGATNAPELYPGENIDVGPQYILKMLPRRTWVEVWLDSQVFFTSNAKLEPDSPLAAPQTSAVLVNTAQFSVTPTAFDWGRGKLSPIVGARSQWYNYSREFTIPNSPPPNLDFEAQTAFVAAKYVYDEKWVVAGEVDYTRLLTQSAYGQFYREVVPNLTVQRVVPLNDDLIFSATWQTAYHFTSVPSVTFSATPTDVNDRLDNILTFSLSYRASPKFVIQPYYSLEYTYYSNDPFNPGTSRNDLLNSVGVSFSYYFTPNLALRAFISGDIRSSNDSAASYENFNAGLDLSLVLRF
jgi:hypothetical protein